MEAEPSAWGEGRGRRTVQITGRPAGGLTVARLVEVERRRPARRPTERIGSRPDRVAMWAVILGFFLILVAATSSRAATPPDAGVAPAPKVAVHTTAAPAPAGVRVPARP